MMQIARLYENEEGQTVVLPKEYGLEGTEVLVYKLGDVVMLFPQGSSWESVIQRLDSETRDNMTKRKEE